MRTLRFDARSPRFGESDARSGGLDLGGARGVRGIARATRCRRGFLVDLLTLLAQRGELRRQRSERRACVVALGRDRIEARLQRRDALAYPGLRVHRVAGRDATQLLFFTRLLELFVAARAD